ncbi:MAG: hypothetical protein IJD58_01715 [Lachnospiraceae bacterium]|nr:hypothetical protein [Lachnospiraceae bacterium]
MEANTQQNLINVHAMGIDISSDYTQLSYIIEGVNEPKSLSIKPGEDKYLISTLMYKIKNAEDWCIGDDAKHRSFEDDDESYVVRNLLERIDTKDVMYLDDVRYSGEKLLRIYLEELFKMAERIENLSRPKYVTITTKKADKVFIDAAHKALNKLGFEDEFVSVISHTESFIYYTLGQKKDLWINDVALFDFNNEHFLYKKLSIARNKVPNIVTVKEYDYSEEIDVTYLESERDKRSADEKFLSIINREFYKQIISSVFLTGTGFYSDFAENSLVELCSKRRVFKGHNLYVKGACLEANERRTGKTKSEYVLQCEGRTKVTIGLMINHNGRNTAAVLSKAGTNWYDAGAKAECILDGTKSIQLVLSSPYDGCTKNVRIDLSSFPDRPNKTTRIAISLAYLNETKCEVVVADLGFGEFYKGTGIVVKETFVIDDMDVE